MSIFSKISRPQLKHSTFNLSHTRKFSLNPGELTPMFCQEVIPGDTWNVNTSQMLRFAPMVSPVMHECNVFTHFFFVPSRIMTDVWENFITGGESGIDEYGLPTVTNLNVQVGGLADYLGLPQGLIEEQISLLPFHAYNMIYDEYYRDQNLIDKMPQDTLDEGNHTPAQVMAKHGANYFNLRRRAWNHDYFTSCLPFAQKGNPVQLPLINTAGQYLDVNYEASGRPDIIRDLSGDDRATPSGDEYLENRGGELHAEINTSESAPINLDNSQNLKVPLDGLQVNASTINDLRKAFKVQEWLELAARGGSRLKEVIGNFFGVTTSDARLQRPEYLGGGMSPVMISEVLQTSETNTSPQGEMAGHGLNLGRGHSFNRFFEEHGYIIGIVSVMPKSGYFQGIPKMFQKLDKFDYFWSQFEHIGEQEVLNKELYYSNTLNDNNDVFGYIPRYAEYKFIPSTVHGDFRLSLDFWHWDRKFGTRPHLNKDFIECNPDSRIFAVQESQEQKLYCQMQHSVTARRKMSYYSDPNFRI